MSESCQNIVSREPLEYCNNEPATEYDLTIDTEDGVYTGSAYFCDDCEPPEVDKT